MNEFRPPGRIVDAIRSFRIHSLYIRNFVISASLILLPLIALNLFLYQVSRHMVTDEATLLSKNALRSTRDVFDSIIREADYVAASIALEQETELFALAGNIQSLLSLDPVRTIAARLKTAVYSNSYIHSIYVYSEATERLITHIGLNERETFPDNGWYDTYLALDDSSINKSFRTISGNFPYVITLIKPLFVFGGEQKNGAVIVNVNLDELRLVLLDPAPNSPEELDVIHTDGTVMFSNRSELLGTRIDISELRKARIGEGTPLIVSSTTSHTYPWTFLSFHALDTYELQSARLRKIVTAVLIISVITTIAAAFFISSSTYRPIRRILAAISNPEQVQRLSRDTASDGPSDETRYIASTIARFTHTNGELRNELQRQIGRLDEARLLALQLQINPHFLNNTLEAINMSARRLTSGANDVTRMVTQLSRLLGISLDTTENIVPLSEEIEHAKIYLDILCIRYRNRFDVEWDIPASMLKYGMLKLSLQPLIENAFYHGIKPTRKKGLVLIRAWLNETNLMVSVSNTGKDISGSLLTKIQRNLVDGNEISSRHVGMKNVDQRTKLLFGRNYGIVISGFEPHGTTVTIRLPAVTLQ